MNLTLEFYEPIYPRQSLLHTVTDDNIISYSVSDESYTSFEYLKSKARNCKLKIFGDSGVYNNLMTFTNFLIDADNNRKEFCSYIVKLKLGDNNLFVGGIKNSSLKRSKKQDAAGNDISIVEFIAYDILEVIKDELNRSETYSSENLSQTYNNTLYNIIYNSIFDSNQYIRISPNSAQNLFNIDFNNNIIFYLNNHYVGLVPIGQGIPRYLPYVSEGISSGDHSFKVAHFIENDGILYLYLGRGGLGEVNNGTYTITIGGKNYDTNTPFRVGARKREVYRIDGLNMTRVYNEDTYPYESNTEDITIWPGEWGVTYPGNGMGAVIAFEDQGIVGFAQNDGNQNPTITIDDDVELEIPQAYNYISQPEYSQIIPNNGDFTYSLPLPGTQLVANGTFQVNNIQFLPTNDETGEAVVKRLDAIKELLVLRDYTMYADNNGILQIKKKSRTPFNIKIIDDEDIITNNISQLKFSIDDLYNLIGNNVNVGYEILEDLLILYYKNLIGINIFEGEILTGTTEYNLGDTIQIEGINYIIYTISRIPLATDRNEYFSMKIKAWETN